MCIAYAAGRASMKTDYFNQKAEARQRQESRERARTDYSSKEKRTFIPEFTDSLQRVDVAAQAKLLNAQCLQSVKCQGGWLRGCRVNGVVDAGQGKFKCIDTAVKGVFRSVGKSVVVKRSSIETLEIHAPPVDKRGRQVKQIIKIVDGKIKNLKLLNGRCHSLALASETPIDFRCNSKFFKLVLKNVIIEATSVA